MGIYEFRGQWHDSEKQAMRRAALQELILPAINGLMLLQGCTMIQEGVWLHEPSDTLCCFSCLPRTRP